MVEPKAIVKQERAEDEAWQADNDSTNMGILYTEEIQFKEDIEHIRSSDISDPDNDEPESLASDEDNGNLEAKYNIVNEMCASSDDVPVRTLRSRKRVNLNQEIECIPILKKWRPSTGSPPSSQQTSSGIHKVQFKSGKHSSKYNTQKPIKLFYECNKCDYKCIKKSQMNKHLKIHNTDKQFACHVCEYKCSQKANLLKHLLIHNGEKQYACDKCDYRSTQKGNLKLHVMTHNGEKQYACDKCEYKCIQKSNLNKHSLIHNGEKQFACDKCEYKSTQKSNLNKHLMIHNGEKQFACDKCDYKCIQKSNLKKHLMIHNGEKQFACDKCDYKCIQKSNLNKHLMIHTGEKQYSCDKCGYNCNQKSNLNKHKCSYMALNYL